ncbi:hypothetical protein D3C76_1796380 [compost metagenome]
MNSGDWVENLSSLEYHNDKWTLFHYEDYKESIMKNKLTDTPIFTLEDLKKLVTI